MRRRSPVDDSEAQRAERHLSHADVSVAAAVGSHLRALQKQRANGDGAAQPPQEDSGLAVFLRLHLRILK